MKEATIEEIAYLLEQAKKNNQPKPIVFLGAGASKSGGIPLAGEIAEDILEKYSRNPKVNKLSPEDQNYPKLMECLLPAERNRLLQEYIKKAKINVTHIYLAQLIIEEYIDYVLTVNFDNLMLRALALYNYFPPTYDLAILKDLTTTSFPEKSVLYLHGQHHGLWLLNTDEEMTKVSEIVPPILNKITNGRPWILIGYSGDDPIFKHIVNLGCFDNGLFWIGYNDSIPNDKVCQDLLNKPNTNASLVKGYDADAFLLALTSKLDLTQPVIFDKPFTFLKDAIENIVDIEDKDHFKAVKQRLEIVKNQVEKAITQFDKGIVEENSIAKADIEVNQVKKEIINRIIAEDYNNIEELTRKVNGINNADLNRILADLYYNWGVTISDLAKTKAGKEQEELYQESFTKFAKAIELNSTDNSIYYNWGVACMELAESKAGKEQEELYQESFTKFAKAIELDPNYSSAYSNWGVACMELAESKAGKEQEELYQESFTKFAKAIELNPKDSSAYSNWGVAISDLAKTKAGKEQEELYQESFTKFAKAIELNPKDGMAYNNWGAAIIELVRIKEEGNQEDQYQESFTKFAKAIELNPKDGMAYNNWGNAIMELGKAKEGKEQETLFKEAAIKLLKAKQLDGSCYNLACVNALQGNKKQAIEILQDSLSNNEVEPNFVLNDNDWDKYKNDSDFINVINRSYKEV